MKLFLALIAAAALLLWMTGGEDPGQDPPPGGDSLPTDHIDLTPSGKVHA